jgi:hypothetical protein
MIPVKRVEREAGQVVSCFFVTSVFDTSHSGSSFYVCIVSSSTVPAEHRGIEASSHKRDRKAGKQPGREVGVIASLGWTAAAATI